MIKQYISKFKNFALSNRERKNHYIDFVNNITDKQITTGPSSYAQNVIVYRCVNLVSQTASHVPWRVFTTKGSKKHLAQFHPVASLLKRPSPNVGGAEFFADLISNKLLYGNAYILSAGVNHTPPREIYLLPSSSVSPHIENGKLIGYKFTDITGTKLYPMNMQTSISKILHIKNHNPNNNFIGLSSLDAASSSIELHSLASKWNSSLLKNGARPTGALIMKDSNTYLTDEQFERIRSQLNEKYVSSSNAGRPMILEGGLDWKEMSISPKDMDFIESKNSAAREIALAFGVPPQLLGINGDSTYSNMQEARFALWEETIIPLLDKLSDSMTNWFSHLFNQEILIDFDRDAISAIAEKRYNIWDKISSSNFMTINEKRAFIGLGPIENGDQLL